MMFDKSLQRLRAQRGIGLLELMLALAIIAVLIIMATRYYQTTARSSRINEAVALVNGIVAAGANHKIGSGSYSSVTKVGDLIDGGLLPPSAANSPWGTAVTVVGAATTLTITMAGVSSTDCTTMTQRFANNKNLAVSAAGGGCQFVYKEVG